MTSSIGNITNEERTTAEKMRFSCRKYYLKLTNILLKKNSKIIIIVVTAFVLGAFAGSFLLTSTSKDKNVTNELIKLQSRKSEAMLRSINDIDSGIKQLSNYTADSKQLKSALQMIQKDIENVKNTAMENAKSSDIEQISKQLASAKDDMVSQIETLKNVVTANNGNKHYLEATALPFIVSAIDVISGQQFLSVNYNNHVMPIAVGDSLAGWRLVNADFDSGTAEFSNEKKQYIKISLKGE